jgi:aspartate carbamoyltransferase regulatory subunit
MKERRVNALENGTVIDHLPPDSVLKVAQILDLETYEKVVIIGMNFTSKKFGTKDILKIEDRYLSKDEADKLALIATGATICLIKNWKVVEKIQVEIPDFVTGIKCANPRCITRHDPIKTKFEVINKDYLKVRCHYCEHVFEKDDVIKNI